MSYTKFTSFHVYTGQILAASLLYSNEYMHVQVINGHGRRNAGMTQLDGLSAFKGPRRPWTV